MKKIFFTLLVSLFFNTTYMQTTKKEIQPKQKKIYQKIIALCETIKNTISEEYENTSKLEKATYLLCWAMAIASATIIDDPQKGTAIWSFLTNNLPDIKNLLPHTETLPTIQKFIPKTLPACGALSSCLGKRCDLQETKSKCNALLYALTNQ